MFIPRNNEISDFKPWHDLMSNKIFYFRLTVPTARLRARSLQSNPVFSFWRESDRNLGGDVATIPPFVTIKGLRIKCF